MAEKGISEKMLMSYSDVFADIINVLIFKGKQVVKPEDLEDMNTWEGYKAIEGLHYMERDIAKWWRKSGIRIACVGFENMSSADARMVFRVYGYDGAEYRIQCTEENRKKPAYPVVTLVLHFCTDKRWKEKAPTSLYETVDVPDELKKFVPNVKINVFDIAWLTPKQVGMFKSDFRIVADYFVQVRKTGKYNGNLEDIKHVYEVLELLSVMENDDRYKKAYYYKNAEGGIHNMCDVIDRLEKMAVEKREEERNVEVATDLLKAGQNDASFVSKISKLSEEAVRKLAKTIGVAVL
ncbi:MAG: Rpn family recombination-promoting nuclease/putative transposase [Clostridia bacterium]|nr:Rpn family recombination-promoting nuclease/putative transposase [Clostridia bacterium]